MADTLRIEKIHDSSKLIKDAAGEIQTNIIFEDQRVGDLVKKYEPILENVKKSNDQMEERVSKVCNKKYVVCYSIFLIIAIVAIVVGLLYLFQV